MSLNRSEKEAVVAEVAGLAAQAQTQKVPANYRTAEFALEHGMIDRVVHRRDIQSYITRTLLFMQSPSK